MRFLLVADRLEKDLTPAGRRRLYEAIRQLSADAHRVTLGELVLDLDRSTPTSEASSDASRSSAAG
ncbi:hypothetical protein AB4144_57120 [Rhizobiaceae sp. 2RAB30]